MRRSARFWSMWRHWKRYLFDTPARHYTFKDTKNWCRGRAGVPHLPYWASVNWDWHSARWPTTHQKFETLVCMVCGKVLGYANSQWPGGVEDPGYREIQRVLQGRMRW